MYITKIVRFWVLVYIGVDMQKLQEVKETIPNLTVKMPKELEVPTTLGPHALIPTFPKKQKTKKSFARC